MVSNETFIDVFQPNLYLGSKGERMWTIDIIRIVCVTIYILLTIKIYFDFKIKGGKIMIVEYIKFLMHPKILLNLIIPISFFLSFHIIQVMPQELLQLLITTKRCFIYTNLNLRNMKQRLIQL